MTVFEAGAHAGGNARTVDVLVERRTYAIDTGFIVFNHLHSPRFTELLDRLGVASQPTDMSFGARSDRTGLEYGTTSIDAMLAQRRNVLRPGRGALVEPAAPVPDILHALRA